MHRENFPNYTFKRAILIYAIAVLFLFYEMGLQVSPSVMAYDLMRSFGLDAGSLGLMSGFYFYSYSLMQLPAGLLYDRVGARIIITLAALGCAIGAFFFGNTYTVAWAALGRFLMGFGSAFAFTGVLVVAALWFKPHRFALLVGLAQFFAALGAAGGAYPLALLIENYDWRIVIMGLSFIGVLITLLAWFVIRDHPKYKISPKIFNSSHIIESLKIVFTNPQTLRIALYAFASWGPITLFAALWGGPFLKVRFTVSNDIAASSLSCIWVGIALTSPFIGWLSDKIKNRTHIMSILAIVGVLSSLILIYMPNIPFWSTYIWMFLIGAASSGQILSFALVKDINPPTVIATAIGFNNMAVVLGGAIFQPLVGFILKWGWEGDYIGDAPFYTLYDYSLALVIVPLCYLICLAASSILIDETHCKPSY